ncbi:MAG: tyrosine-type recombinase/integrase [Bacteroidetes bacterium]|jgi:integrase/recombinase XerD|nr:tyrosine-type recombinase/integrase [Bacteroidota bacterium]MDF2453458.1 tyrosine-type recombinase/integrase [Bacteroidota bacterium]
MIKELTIEHLRHHDQQRVFLRFENDGEASALVRNQLNGKWSATQCAWHIPYEEKVFEKVCEVFYKYQVRVFMKNTYEGKQEPVRKESVSRPGIALPDLSEEARLKVGEFNTWLKWRRYSDNTINSYTEALKLFLRFYHHKALSDINNEDLIRYNTDYILANKFSASFQNQVINAVKLFFKIIEFKTLHPELIYRPKSPKLLPNVLSKEEVKQILDSPRNLKHKAMLSLIYSCGLRCGELLRLNLQDVDSKRGVLIIKQSKGRKDRIAPLSQKIVALLRDYYVAFKPGRYLFEGQQKGMMYDERSLQNVLKQAIKKAGIYKPVSLHWLRHSYATHLLENGTDLRYIQEILGHSSSKTTEIYTHVSTKSIQNVTSPFDYL